MVLCVCVSVCVLFFMFVCFFVFGFFFPFKTILSFPILEKRFFVVVSGGDINVSSKRQLSCAIVCVRIWSASYKSYSLPGLLIYRNLVCEWQKKRKKERKFLGISICLLIKFQIMCCSLLWLYLKNSLPQWDGFALYALYPSTPFKYFEKNSTIFLRYI